MTPAAPLRESERPRSVHPVRERLLVPATLGIRHFSPASAKALEALLEDVQPTCILLEAPTDAAAQIRELGAPGNVPPVGLVGLRSAMDAARFLYPIAAGSPEWVAVRWAHQHGCAVEGIDLPGATQLALSRAVEAHRGPVFPDPYAAFAAQAGAADFDVWWERHLEHATAQGTYEETIWALALGLREQPWPHALHAEWLLREAFMRRRIREVLASGIPAERCVVVCGAIHLPALTVDAGVAGGIVVAAGSVDPRNVHTARPEAPERSAAAPAPEDDRSLAGLTWFPVALTDARLTSVQGSGGRSPPPAYLRLLADAQADGAFEAIAPRLLGRVAERLRRVGSPVSPAQVIDAIRLARQLAALCEPPVTTLEDLRDAAMTCFSATDDAAVVAAAFEEAARGTDVGHLMAVRPLLAIELDERLKALQLPMLRGGLHQELTLDLRPLPGALATERSVLLHRLRALGLPGIRLKLQAPSGTLAPWIETWELRGRPEVEEVLAEAGLLGDSLEAAVLARLDRRLEEARTLGAIVALWLESRACALPQLLARLAALLEQTDLEQVPFGRVVGAAEALRQAASRPSHPTDEEAVSAAPLIALVRAAIRRLPLLPELAGADGEDAIALGLLVRCVSATGLEQEALHTELRALAVGLQGRPRLRGRSLALCLDPELLSGQELAVLLASRLEGHAIRTTATWVEGLLSHDRQALLRATPLWRALEAWVQSAGPAAFARGLVPLRRMFATWDAGERSQLTALRGQGFHASDRSVDAAAVDRHPHDGVLARALERLDGLDL